MVAPGSYWLTSIPKLEPWTHPCFFFIFIIIIIIIVIIISSICSCQGIWSRGEIILLKTSVFTIIHVICFDILYKQLFRIYLSSQSSIYTAFHYFVYIVLRELLNVFVEMKYTAQNFVYQTKLHFFSCSKTCTFSTSIYQFTL